MFYQNIDTRVFSETPNRCAHLGSEGPTQTELQEAKSSRLARISELFADVRSRKTENRVAKEKTKKEKLLCKINFLLFIIFGTYFVKISNAGNRPYDLTV